MRGHQDLNKPKFDFYAKRLRDEGHEVFSPVELDPKRPLKELFAEEFNWIILQADEVALLPRWNTSLGAVAEHAIAKALSLKVRFL